MHVKLSSATLGALRLDVKIVVRDARPFVIAGTGPAMTGFAIARCGAPRMTYSVLPLSAGVFFSAMKRSNSA